VAFDLLVATPVEGVAERELRIETAFAALRFVVGLAFLVGAVTLLGWRFRAELSSFGVWFVDRFGVGGMFLGSLLADGIHFPVPPQFYLLTGIAAGHSRLVVVASVLVGSEIGGLLAFSLARTIAVRSAFLRARLAAPRRLLLRLMGRRGYLGLALATLLPISFSLLCMTAGAMELPYRAYGVLGAMRVPRILLSYVVIVLAWHGLG
jgi:membrane protein YqaA with SNARE-associated domain